MRVQQSAESSIPIEFLEEEEETELETRCDRALKRFFLGAALTTGATACALIFANKQIVVLAKSYAIPYLGETLTIGIVAMGLLGGSISALIGDRFC